MGHVLSGKVLIINHEFRIGYSIIADSVKEHFQFLFKHGNILFMIQLCLVEQLVLHDYKYTPNKYRIGQADPDIKSYYTVFPGFLQVQGYLGKCNPVSADKTTLIPLFVILS